MTRPALARNKVYKDVDHATLMKEKVAIEGWTQQLLVDRQAEKPPYIRITKVGR